MSAEVKRIDALQLIYSFFLGILLVIFVGVGVWTFYPQPYEEDSPEQRELERLYEQQGALLGKSLKTPENDAEANRIQKRIDAINDTMRMDRDRWAVNTSIILISFATLLMAISLFLPEHMKVFSNGVLLGGLFTMIYGTGWSFAGGDSRARFFVVLAALVLSVGIGYLRFIRHRHDASSVAAVATPGPHVATAAPGFGDAEAIVALSARVSDLERRAAAAAAALGRAEDTDE